MTEAEDVEVWLIDGFNVLHACVLESQAHDHWWTESAQSKLLTWLGTFALTHAVTVVFDARSPASPRCAAEHFSGRLYFAENADDAIVGLVKKLEGSRVCVVTADRSLADRSRHAGASHLRPWDFARQFVASST